MAEVVLSGKAYRLFYTMDAASELEERWGLNILKLDEIADEEWERPTTINRLLWAGVLCDHPDITLKEVGRMFDLGQLPEAIEQIGAALKEQFAREENPTEGTTSPPSEVPSVVS